MLSLGNFFYNYLYKLLLQKFYAYLIEFFNKIIFFQVVKTHQTVIKLNDHFFI
jgi:hypothetical protein